LNDLIRYLPAEKPLSIPRTLISQAYREDIYDQVMSSVVS